MKVRGPRSLMIRQPYRGRTIRGLMNKWIPGGRFILSCWQTRKASLVRTIGNHQLKKGKSEGRRLMTAIPHPFCGIGHGFAEWHTGFMWAQELGLEHVNIPMKDDWNEVLGLGSASLDYWEALETLTPVVIRLPLIEGKRGETVPPIIKDIVGRTRSTRNILFILGDGQNLFDHTAGDLWLRERFESQGRWRDFPDHAVQGALNVAVHLRRGDVAVMAEKEVSNWNERFVSEEWFISIMDSITAVVGLEFPIKFHIYSQGRMTQFQRLACRPDCCFHLDSSEIETLVNMSRADILIMSPSGFSYLAGLLNSGLKIARVPWWHRIPNSEDWIGLKDKQNITLCKIRNWWEKSM